MQDNITSIIRHFSIHLDHWQAEHQNSVLTERMVADIIKANYSSLSLNLFDGLEHYEGYMENPKEVAFFKQYVRMVIFDTKSLLRVESTILCLE